MTVTAAAVGVGPGLEASPLTTVLTATLAAGFVQVGKLNHGGLEGLTTQLGSSFNEKPLAG